MCDSRKEWRRKVNDHQLIASLLRSEGRGHQGGWEGSENSQPSILSRSHWRCFSSMFREGMREGQEERSRREMGGE